jgi:alpha-L-fucosidase 2
MPLGNGRLGVAVWSAEGFAAQLNRGDTLPHRDSPGQLVIPGLAALFSAKDFHGYLDLYNGTLVEHGGGLSVSAWVQSSTDTLIIDVTGADPKARETAELRLWEPRTPEASANDRTGMLAQTWIDNYGPSATKAKFGALAAVTALGRNVSATVTNTRTVTVAFQPEANGHFRVVVACPHYNGEVSKEDSIRAALSNTDPAEHLAQWHAFWQHAGLIKVTSTDGSGEYMENLRNLYLYVAEAMSGGRFPGSQAGIADLFSAVRDVHRWDPAAYWHWNLRMQVAANLDAGVAELNEPYFRLYRENLANIEDWTRTHMAGRPGICVPETMRFNGPGVEYEDWNPSSPAVALNCAADFKPYYNARTLSTGSEISLWIWQQYLMTGDLKFLAENYPVMAASARFLLAYETQGSDGKKHTQPSNAHEQQWDTLDPTTDLSARTALYPAVMRAATLLRKDSDLIARLKSELSLIPPLPDAEKTLDTKKVTVIAASHDPAAAEHNEENVGLEPVWPYNLIGDDSPQMPLAQDTYFTRPFPVHQDWSYDPVQAARLGLSMEVRSTLIALTQHYQKYINGFANWGGPAGEFYVEQEGNVALGLSEALVQDYDGLIRIAPAVPAEWNMEGTVWIRNRTRIDVQVRSAGADTVVIEAGATETLHVRNRWARRRINITDAQGKILSSSADAVLNFRVQQGKTYQLVPSDRPALPYASITGTRPSSYRRLGPVQIGK